MKEIHVLQGHVNSTITLSRLFDKTCYRLTTKNEVFFGSKIVISFVLVIQT